MPLGKPGFWSKVARFVRHRTLDGSAVDHRAQGLVSERDALDRIMRQMRRNDRVRQLELDHLRMLMRQRPALRGPYAMSDAPDQGQAAVLAPTFAGGVDRTGRLAKTHTMEQIARIELQMSRNWMSRRDDGTVAGLRIAGSSGLTPSGLGTDWGPSAHLGARVGQQEPDKRPLDVPAGQWHGGSEWREVLADPGLAQAAVQFAQAEYAQAEQGLRTLVAQEPLSWTARLANLALLDLLHARRDFEGFEEFAAEYGERYGLPVPRWPANAQAAGLSSAAHSACVANGVQQPSHWVCPLFLDQAAVQALCAAMAGPGANKWLDWSGLLSVELAAAQALLDEVHRWLAQPLELQFLGAAVLRRRLKAGTPSGRRENEPHWWQLRLALLRLMRRRDEFDLVALDYCVTYGVLPPQWEEPVCRFKLADDGPHAAPALEVVATQQALSAPLQELNDSQWPAMLTAMHSGQTCSPVAHTPMAGAIAVRWSGTLTGDMSEVLSALDQALGRHEPEQVFVIDCQGLDRVDLGAAGTLLQWLMVALSRGVQVELRGLSRLVAAFFYVLGMGEVVALRLRQY